MRGYGLFKGDRDLLLTVPDNVKVTDLKWISLWCRQFGVNFGEAFLDQQAAESSESSEIEKQEKQYDS